jgi:hypothetical protein
LPYGAYIVGFAWYERIEMKIIVCVCLLLFVTEYSGESSALTNHRSKHEVEATPESAKVEAISESRVGYAVRTFP